MPDLMNFLWDFEHFPNNYRKPLKCIRRIKRGSHQLQVGWRRNVKGISQNPGRGAGDAWKDTAAGGNVTGRAV